MIKRTTFLSPITILLLGLFTTPELMGQQTSRDLTELAYGNHAIGFRFIEAYDFSRSGILEQSDRSKRITPIYLWYPGRKDSESETKRMSLRAYLNHWAKETNYEIPKDSVHFYSRRNFARSFLWLKDLSSFEKLYAAGLNTLAFENISPLEGKFPVVLLTHGAGINWQFIAEFLASHGYIVGYAPVTGTYDKRLEGSLTGVATELADAENVLNHISQISVADMNKIGIIGNSLGSLAAVVLASKNKSIKAVISLDGVIGDNNEGDVLFDLPYYDNHNMTSSLLHFSGGNLSNNYSKIEKMALSDRYIVEMEGMRHSDFIGQGWYDGLGVKLSGNANGDYRKGIQQVNSYALSFLNAFLKEDKVDLDNKFKAPVDGLIKNKRTIPRESGKYSLPDLIKLIFDENFDDLSTAYHANKGLTIKAFSYDTFHDVCMQLYFRNHYKQAAIWSNYFVESYPEAAKAHYLLGNMRRRTGETELAVEALSNAQKLMDKDKFLSDNQKQLYKDRLKSILENLKSDN